SAEMVRALVLSTEAQIVSYRVASIAASMDPIAFLLFVSGLTQRPLRRVSFLAACVASAAFALWAGWAALPVYTPDNRALGGFGDFVFSYALGVFTAVVYVSALASIAARLRVEPAEPRWRWLFAAACAVVLPRVYLPLNGVGV